MIRKPTILIFGAGVSLEYGFPLGRSLLLSIVETLKQEGSLRYTMKTCDFTYGLIEQFRSELNLSGQPSVDAFLEQHKSEPDFVKLGKAAIAASLIPCEQDPILNNRTDRRLYEYLWHQIAGTPGDYARNRLSILTFNYDRSFEQYLRTVLKASHPEFRDGGSQFTAALSQFDVFHFYGSFGSLDSGSESHLGYGAGGDRPTHPAHILAAAERIKLYHEARFSDRTLEPIRALVREAETICFLGFGFHPINIRILKLCGVGDNKTTRHFAAAYDIQEGERASIRNLLGFDLQLTPASYKSLEAVRTLPVLVSS